MPSTPCDPCALDLTIAPEVRARVRRELLLVPNRRSLPASTRTKPTTSEYFTAAEAAAYVGVTVAAIRK